MQEYVGTIEDKGGIMQIARRTMIVGLGGMGVRTALYIKKVLYQYYGDTPKSVQILVLDTDQSDMDRSILATNKIGEKKFITLNQEERMYLDVDLPLEVIKDPSIQDWWPKGLPTSTVINGAGQIRALGRLAVHAHAENVRKQLNGLITQLFNEKLRLEMKRDQNIKLEGSEIDIHIIGSIAGGTGSGSFLDIAFLIKHLVKKQKCDVYGYLVLPWIFEDLTATDRIGMNAFAALRELDHYMGLSYRGSSQKEAQFHFGSEVIKPSSPPFNMVNLIDGRNEDNQNIKESGCSKGVDNLSELIGMGIVLNMSSTGKVVKAINANIHSQNATDWGGKSPCYSSFGVSSMVYPIEKHFNRTYNAFAMMLIEEGLRISRNESTGANAAEASDDVKKFITDVGLLDDGNQVIDALLLPRNINAEIRLPYFLPPFEKVKRDADQTSNRVDEEVDAKLSKNSSEIQDNAAKKLIAALESREKDNGPSYTLAFLDMFIGHIEAYYSNRNAEIQELDREIAWMREREQELENKADNITRLERLLRRKRAYYKNYVKQVTRVLRETMESKRRKKALYLFNYLIEEAGAYRDKLNLPEIEKGLSQMRSEIYADLIGTTILEELYGEYTVMVEPLRIFVRGDSIRIGIGDEKSISRTDTIQFSEFLEERGIRIDFNAFLQECGLNSIGQLTELTKEELHHKLVNYSQVLLKDIQDMSLEDVLLLGVATDEEQREKLGENLEELYLRAKPMWYHEAVGSRAERMIEVSILGVADVATTRLKEDDILKYLPRSQYLPSFASTDDPWKLFCFKSKSPLPAYMLCNMEDYRNKYENTPVVMTPHVGMQMELKLNDLFPSEPGQEACFRIFSLAASPCFGIVEIKQDIQGGQLIESFHLKDEKLGDSRSEALNRLTDDGGEELVLNIKQSLVNSYEADSEIIRQQLTDYLKKCEQRFAKEREKIENDPNTALTIGEEILMDKEIKVLRSFLRGKVDIQDFLELRE